jgi:Aldo/keto reductase family
LASTTSVRHPSSWFFFEANQSSSFPDTAQAYQNEAEAGTAIRESGLARQAIFITTKYSGLNGLDIPTSINNSLKNVRTSYFYFPSSAFFTFAL